MDISEAELERAAATMIAEFGEGAAQETSARIAESEARGFSYSAQAWQCVLEWIKRLRNEGHDEAS